METRKPSGYARLINTSANNSTDLLSLPMCHVLQSMLRIVPGTLSPAPFRLPYIIILMWNKLNLHLPLSLCVCACVCKCMCAHVCVCMHFHVSSHSASDINPTVFSGFCLSLARQIMLTASLCASSRVGIKSPFLIQSLLSTLHVKGVQCMP